MAGRPKLLDVGGGGKGPPLPPYYRDFEHLRLDIDPRVEPEILADARDLLLHEPEVFDAILCSHNLEHYFPHEVPRVLQGFQRVLKPDGFCEIKVPDIAEVMRTAVTRNLDIEDTLYTLESGMPIAVRDVIYGWSREIEQSGSDFYAHRTGFTPRSLANAVLGAGFAFILRRKKAPFEIRVFAFKSRPTPAQETRLGFSFDSTRRADGL